MLKSYLKFSLLLLLILPVSAEPAYEELRDMLLLGNSEAVIKAVEAEKDIDWIKHKFKISPKICYLYAISLITVGDIERAEIFLDDAIIRHKKNQDLKYTRKQLSFFYQDYNHPELNYTKLETNHIELVKLMDNYLENKNIDTKNQILQLLGQTTNDLAYFPSRFEYLLALDEYQRAETEALASIKNLQGVLFPKSMDLYHLGLAYRSLAIISAKENNLDQAYSFIKLAQQSIDKIRSVWIEEDIIVAHRILKTQERSTKFGFLIPQWIIGLREEFAQYVF